MANYHFISHWHFNAPIEQVWHEIKTMSQWPEWWSYVQKVELLKEGGLDDIGSVRRTTWKTALPYSLSFESELTVLEKYERIEGRATGELEGKGIWTFASEGETTKIQYDWIVKTTKPWMNLLAPIARPLFAWNHRKVMAVGYEGLKKRLALRAKIAA